MTIQDDTAAAKLEEHVVSFREMLEATAGLDDERRRLFQEVYENAVKDRMRASELFDDLSKCMHESATNVEASHALHGQTLARYLERMHRSNEQLMKLAEMIADASSGPAEPNIDDVFSEIESGKLEKKRVSGSKKAR